MASSEPPPAPGPAEDHGMPTQPFYAPVRHLITENLWAEAPGQQEAPPGRLTCGQVEAQEPAEPSEPQTGHRRNTTPDPPERLLPYRTKGTEGRSEHLSGDEKVPAGLQSCRVLYRGRSQVQENLYSSVILVETS